MAPGDDIRHFLVARDVRRGLTTVDEFGLNYDAALEAYQEAEKQVGWSNDLDIVLLGADSLDTIKCTHSSYFGLSRSTICS